MPPAQISSSGSLGFPSLKQQQQIRFPPANSSHSLTTIDPADQASAVAAPFENAKVQCWGRCTVPPVEVAPGITLLQMAAKPGSSMLDVANTAGFEVGDLLLVDRVAVGHITAIVEPSGFLIGFPLKGCGRPCASVMRQASCDLVTCPTLYCQKPGQQHCRGATCTTADWMVCCKKCEPGEVASPPPSGHFPNAGADGAALHQGAPTWFWDLAKAGLQGPGGEDLSSMAQGIGLIEEAHHRRPRRHSLQQASDYDDREDDDDLFDDDDDFDREEEHRTKRRRKRRRH